MDKDEVTQFYAHAIEKDRLDLDHFKLEGLRTKEIISRYLSNKALTIADVGGGAGFYTFWLHELGHRVSFVDLTPKNVELVETTAKAKGITLEHCQVGDAMQLPLADNSFDIVLLLGPLYHLTEHTQRLAALREAKRILKPGGILIAAVISRYASLFDGFRRDLIKDDQFEKILREDLKSGIHRNPTGNLEYFTTAFFHTPAQIRAEVVESGLLLQKLVAIEGAGWLIDNVSVKMTDQRYWNKVQTILQMTEDNDDLVALSPHIMVIASK